MTQKQKNQRILLAVYEWYEGNKHTKGDVMGALDVMSSSVDLAMLLVEIIEDDPTSH